jgi:hypothetical protein
MVRAGRTASACMPMRALQVRDMRFHSTLRYCIDHVEARATTIAPVTSRFTSVSGSMTFQP